MVALIPVPSTLGKVWTITLGLLSSLLQEHPMPLLRRRQLLPPCLTMATNILPLPRQPQLPLARMERELPLEGLGTLVCLV